MEAKDDERERGAVVRERGGDGASVEIRAPASLRPSSRRVVRSVPSRLMNVESDNKGLVRTKGADCGESILLA